MARHYFFQAVDPRSTAGEHYLGVYFTIENPGQDPAGYGEHYDPGCGPEFTIVSVQDDVGGPVELTDEQPEVVETEICERFDFEDVARSEREEAY